LNTPLVTKMEGGGLGGKKKRSGGMKKVRERWIGESEKRRKERKKKWIRKRERSKIKGRRKEKGERKEEDGKRK